jgi:hypothetical protein
MVLSDVEETVTIVEVDDESEDEAVRVISPSTEALFCITTFDFESILISRLSRNDLRCCL